MITKANNTYIIVIFKKKQHLYDFCMFSLFSNKAKFNVRFHGTYILVTTRLHIKLLMLIQQSVEDGY